VTKSSVHRGEHEGNRNTIVQGMPGCLGEPVVTTLVCFFYFAYEAAGAVERPAFPAPSPWRDTNFVQPGRLSRRGNAKPCVIARSLSDEAIQNPDASRILDRFAAARDDDGWPGLRLAEGASAPQAGQARP
jgi:hypothetical protein